MQYSTCLKTREDIYVYVIKTTINCVIGLYHLWLENESMLSLLMNSFIIKTHATKHIYEQQHSVKGVGCLGRVLLKFLFK